MPTDINKKPSDEFYGSLGCVGLGGCACVLGTGLFVTVNYGFVSGIAATLVAFGVALSVLGLTVLYGMKKERSYG